MKKFIFFFVLSFVIILPVFSANWSFDQLVALQDSYYAETGEYQIIDKQDNGLSSDRIVIWRGKGVEPIRFYTVVETFETIKQTTTISDDLTLKEQFDKIEPIKVIDNSVVSTTEKL